MKKKPKDLGTKKTILLKLKKKPNIYEEIQQKIRRKWSPIL